LPGAFTLLFSRETNFKTSAAVFIILSALSPFKQFHAIISGNYLTELHKNCILFINYKTCRMKKTIVFIATAMILCSYAQHTKVSHAAIPAHTVAARPDHKMKASTKSSKSLDDVTVEIYSNCWRDVDIWLTNEDTSYFLNIHPWQTDATITVPEGKYDISIWPNDSNAGYHSFYVGCGNYGGGYPATTFWGVSITPDCNDIIID
jgi:hypothetical protein